MANRCYFECRVRRADAVRFSELIGFAHDGGGRFVHHDSPCGYGAVLATAASEGLQFYGHTGDGIDFDACDHVSDGSTFYEVESRTLPRLAWGLGAAIPWERADFLVREERIRRVVDGSWDSNTGQAPEKG